MDHEHLQRPDNFQQQPVLELPSSSATEISLKKHTIQMVGRYGYANYEQQ